MKRRTENFNLRRSSDRDFDWEWNYLKVLKEEKIKDAD
jgi:hypothetical protein